MRISILCASGRGLCEIFPENGSLQEVLMGVETPIPPNRINAAAPDGAPPRRIKKVELFICRFSWCGCEPGRS